MPRVVVLGIGNTLMGDDGAGVVIARRLVGAALPDGVCVVERAAPDMGLLAYFLEPGRIFVADAIDAGSEPGAIFRFAPDEAGVTGLRSNSIHGMGVGYLVTSARLLGAKPDVVIFGIQVADIRPRPDRLSPVVAEAVEETARLLGREAAAAAQCGPGVAERPAG
ncbi:MAG: hydrogenase maturation protease [Coriobacteriia bacterium]